MLDPVPPCVFEPQILVSSESVLLKPASYSKVVKSNGHKRRKSENEWKAVTKRKKSPQKNFERGTGTDFGFCGRSAPAIKVYVGNLVSSTSVDVIERHLFTKLKIVARVTKLKSKKDDASSFLINADYNPAHKEKLLNLKYGIQGHISVSYKS